MMKQIKINKMLSKIKSHKNVYNTYGSVIRINTKLSTVLIYIDFIIPSFRLITLFALLLRRLRKDISLFVLLDMETVKKSFKNFLGVVTKW